MPKVPNPQPFARYLLSGGRCERLVPEHAWSQDLNPGLTLEPLASLPQQGFLCGLGPTDKA